MAGDCFTDQLLFEELKAMPSKILTIEKLRFWSSNK